VAFPKDFSIPPVRRRTMEGMSIQPVLIKRECGGWLAVTPDDVPLRLGMEGEDEQAAIDAYNRERANWIEILARSDSHSVSGR
jgi:hypothetical protein